MTGGRKRDGRMRGRDERSKRVPKLGHYIIVTDAVGTERHYFEGLRRSLPPEVAGKLVLKVYSGVEYFRLVRYCLEEAAKVPQYAEPWIVFDRDEVPQFDEIIEEAERRGINVAWSNPCFEVWLASYFDSIPSQYESTACVKAFEKLFERHVGRAYRKGDPSVYETLCAKGDEGEAFARAQAKREAWERDAHRPSEMAPCTKVDILVSEIRGKAEFGKGGAV